MVFKKMGSEMFSLLKVDHSDCKATLSKREGLARRPDCNATLRTFRSKKGKSTDPPFYGVRDEYFSSNIFGDLEEIYYFCSMNEDIRETYHSAEYDEYYASLDAKTKAKYDYVETIIKTQYVVNKKFVKNLEGTEFYEARISVGTNEHRTIVFAVDSYSFMESKRVLFLNSFLKKDTKQYRGEIETARQILNKYIQGGQEDDKA